MAVHRGRAVDVRGRVNQRRRLRRDPRAPEVVVAADGCGARGPDRSPASASATPSGPGTGTARARHPAAKARRRRAARRSTRRPDRACPRRPPGRSPAHRPRSSIRRLAGGDSASEPATRASSARWLAARGVHQRVDAGVDLTVAGGAAGVANVAAASNQRAAAATPANKRYLTGLDAPEASATFLPATGALAATLRVQTPLGARHGALVAARIGQRRVCLDLRLDAREHLDRRGLLGRQDRLVLGLRHLGQRRLRRSSHPAASRTTSGTHRRPSPCSASGPESSPRRTRPVRAGP